MPQVSFDMIHGRRSKVQRLAQLATMTHARAHLHGAQREARGAAVHERAVHAATVRQQVVHVHDAAVTVHHHLLPCGVRLVLLRHTDETAHRSVRGERRGGQEERIVELLVRWVLGVHRLEHGRERLDHPLLVLVRGWWRLFLVLHEVVGVRAVKLHAVVPARETEKERETSSQ